VQQHEWELAQTHRTKVTLLLSLLSVIVQGAPWHVAVRACACRVSPRLRESARIPVCRCRSAHVCRELLPDLRRRQHRQDGACAAWHRISCSGRSLVELTRCRSARWSRRFWSRWCC
jgi:hypothetical protein